MKASLVTAKKYLKENEQLLSSLYCKIHLNNISRSGILVATTERLLFCADAIVGKGYKWDFLYCEISNISENKGFVLGTTPFIKKLLVYTQEEIVIFENFSNSYEVDEFLKLIKLKINK
ncbi:PH domain-containing protein [Priestia sp. SB1]|uniref:PH domain-containing protein n=1 Tax=Priestia sp. SB1 TaxID=3132359 RepID=UPI0031745B1A